MHFQASQAESAPFCPPDKSVTFLIERRKVYAFRRVLLQYVEYSTSRRIVRLELRRF